LRWRIVSHSSDPKAGGLPLTGCPRLLIQYIRSYPPCLEAVSLIRNPRTRHAMVIGTHVPVAITTELVIMNLRLLLASSCILKHFKESKWKSSCQSFVLSLGQWLTVSCDKWHWNFRSSFVTTVGSLWSRLSTCCTRCCIYVYIRCAKTSWMKLLYKGKSKVVSALNKIPRYEGVWRSGGITPRIINLYTRWR
jgi:hypothetical protein